MAGFAEATYVITIVAIIFAMIAVLMEIDNLRAELSKTSKPEPKASGEIK